MDFDANGKFVYEMVPIGSYRFLLMVHTVCTEVMSCQRVDKGVYPRCVLQFEMYIFVRTYFRTVYFVITYLLCLFLILFGSSVISTDIQKDIITKLIC